MLHHEHDETADAHYIQEADEFGLMYGSVAKTVDLGKRTVNLDYDREGNLIGIELL